MMQSIDQPLSGVVTMKRTSSTPSSPFPSSSSTQQLHYKLVKHSQDIKKSAFLSWKKIPLSLFSHPNTLAIMKKKDPAHSRKSTLMLDAQYTQVKLLTNESINKKHPHCFSIKSHIEGKHKEEEWILECSSRAECEEWVESIKKLMNRGVGGGAGVNNGGSAGVPTNHLDTTTTNHLDTQQGIVVPEFQHSSTTVVVQSSSSSSVVPNATTATNTTYNTSSSLKVEELKKSVINSSTESTTTNTPSTAPQESTSENIVAASSSLPLKAEEDLEPIQPANQLDDELYPIEPAQLDDDLDPIEPAKLDEDEEEEPAFVLQNAVAKKVVEEDHAMDHENQQLSSSHHGKKKTVLKNEDSDDDDIIVTKKKQPSSSSTSPSATKSTPNHSQTTTNTSTSTTSKHESSTSSSMGGPPNKAKKTVLKDDDSSSDEENDKVVKKTSSSSTTTPSPSGGPPNKSKKTILKDESDDDDDDAPKTITSSGAPPKRSTENSQPKTEENEQDDNNTIIRKPSSQNASSNSLKSANSSIVEVNIMDPLFELSEDEKDEDDRDDDDDYDVDNEEGEAISSLSQLIEELEYNSNCRAKAMKCAKYLHSHFVKNKKQLIDDLLHHEGLQSCICMINDNTKSYSIVSTGLSICVEVIESTAPNNEQYKALMRLTGCMSACIDIIKRHYRKFLKRMTLNNQSKTSTTTHVEHVRVISLAVQVLGMLSEKPSDHVNELLTQLENMIKQCDEVISKVYTLKQLTLSYELSRNMFILLNNICLHNIESLKTISRKQGAFDIMIKFVVYHYGVSIPNKINDDENAIIIPLTKFVTLTGKDTSKIAKMELAKSMVMQGGVSSLLSASSKTNTSVTRSSNIQQYITKIFVELSDSSPLIMKSFKNIVQLNLKNKELVTNTLNVIHTIYRNKSDTDAREKLIQVLATEFGSLFFAALSKYADDGWVVSFCVEFLYEIEKYYPSVLEKAWSETSADQQLSSQTVYTHVRTLILSLSEFNDNELYEMMMSLFLKHLENDPKSAGTQFASTFGFHVALLDIIQRSTTPHILTLTLHVLSLVIPHTQFKMKRSSIEKDNRQLLVENILSKDIREKLISSCFSKLKDATNMEKEGCIFLCSILQGIAQHYETFKVSVDDMKSLVKCTQTFTHSDHDGELSLSLLKLVAQLNELDSNATILQKSGCVDLCKKLVQLHGDRNKEVKEFAKNQLSTLL
ncbi:hypothetical protein C9374_007930 [Naegleria lovaniensis]|uniref:PH domain-containing protein n=1 Tax=Naegleria lovaniensis TaxID=51637 RepID=A0AA88GK07_NAELO|nr:uncharacterized protein C9374_007930 [Naegleria lovaniensis]KAG2378782.1 hypothetical protein C9374_007930 [Naegleria lovaniensis]